MAASRPMEVGATEQQGEGAKPTREPRTRPTGVRIIEVERRGRPRLARGPFLGRRTLSVERREHPGHRLFDLGEQLVELVAQEGFFEAPGVIGALEGPQVDGHTTQAKVGNRIVLGA